MTDNILISHKLEVTIKHFIEYAFHDSNPTQRMFISATAISIGNISLGNNKYYYNNVNTWQICSSIYCEDVGKYRNDNVLNIFFLSG